MENVNFSEGLEGEGAERVLVGRRRETEGYVKATEEGMQNIFLCDGVCEDKNIYGQQVR